MSTRILKFPERQGRSRRKAATPDATLTATPTRNILSRGVWFAPYAIAGRTAACVITSKGDKVADFLLEEKSEHWDQITDALRQLLDAVDPPTSTTGGLELHRVNISRTIPLDWRSLKWTRNW